MTMREFQPTGLIKVQYLHGNRALGSLLPIGFIVGASAFLVGGGAAVQTDTTPAAWAIALGTFGLALLVATSAINRKRNDVLRLYENGYELRYDGMHRVGPWADVSVVKRHGRLGYMVTFADMTVDVWELAPRRVIRSVIDIIVERSNLAWTGNQATRSFS